MIGSYVEQYDPWIKKVTRRMWLKFHKYYQFEDLLGVAYVAAVEAEKTYDKAKAKFSTYVRPRIEGAIIRSVSNITDSEHKKLLEIYQFINEYIEKHNKVPAQHIILKSVGITERQFLSLISATTKIIEVPLEGAEATDELNIDDMDTKAEYGRVEDIIEQLPKHHRKAIQDFLDNPNSSVDKIADVVAIIKSKLNIKDT